MGDTTAADRCRGVLVGLAAGDRNGGPVRMAVRLAESLGGAGRFDPADALARYLAWWRDGAFDTGPVAARALGLVAAGVPTGEAVARVHREFGGLAAAGIGIFAVSTFDTDYLFVKEAEFLSAVAALRRAGHTVEGVLP